MLKTFKLNIDETEDTGMEAISLVEYPAVEVDFLAFNKEQEIEQLFFNDEKHEIYGVVCLADTPIYRFNSTLGEHYIVFDKDTIKKMVLKYSKMNFNNNINIEHQGELVSGLTMIESFIKDVENGIDPVQFKNVNDGSWICRFKVENPDIWEKIKSKEVKGFSLEGFFKYDFSNQNKEDKSDWLDDLLNNINN